MEHTTPNTKIRWKYLCSIRNPPQSLISQSFENEFSEDFIMKVKKCLNPR